MCLVEVLSIVRRIDDLYLAEKRNVRGITSRVEFMCCTTDMWTSRSGDGYLSLTSNFITSNFKLHFKNLQTRHFPGTHDYNHIEEAISTAAQEWCVNIPKQVVAFTTDSGSNVVKALGEMGILRLPCAGHTLNLAVQKGHSHREMQKIISTFSQI